MPWELKVVNRRWQMHEYNDVRHHLLSAHYDKTSSDDSDGSQRASVRILGFVDKV